MAVPSPQELRYSPSGRGCIWTAAGLQAGSLMALEAVAGSCLSTDSHYDGVPVPERADGLRGGDRGLALPIIQGELWFGGEVGVYRKGHLPDRTTIGKIDKSLAFSSD